MCYKRGAAWDFAVREAEAPASRRKESKAVALQQAQGPLQEGTHAASATGVTLRVAGGVNEVLESPDVDDAVGDGALVVGEIGPRQRDDEQKGVVVRPWKLDELRA